MKYFSGGEIVFLSAKRTPFGSFGGSLKSLSATDLGVSAARAALQQSGVNVNKIDHVIFGNVMQTSVDSIYLARHVGLRCELPVGVPALTLNRLCGSGFQAIVSGAEQLALGLAHCVLVGGAESMSQAPHIVRGARWGLKLGANNELEDSLWTALNDTFVHMPMAMTAEKLAEEFHISQEEVDAYSVNSQQRHAIAHSSGAFLEEMATVEIVERRATRTFSVDEHARANTNLEDLKKLPKVFKKDGVVHAAAASGICDGAAALVMSTQKFAAENSLSHLGRLVSFGIVGCDPSRMGLGPVPAIKQALDRAELKLSDLDLVEVNEAFAPQVLAVQKELKIPLDRLNIHGGALALGHPLAASGARIAAHLLHSLRRENKRLGIGAACIGGGQGIAVIVENK